MWINTDHGCFSFCLVWYQCKLGLIFLRKIEMNWMKTNFCQIFKMASWGLRQSVVPNNIVVRNVVLLIFYPMMVRGMVLCEFWDVLEPCSILADVVTNFGVSVVNTNCSPDVGDYLSLWLMCHWESRCCVDVLILIFYGSWC